MPLALRHVQTTPSEVTTVSTMTTDTVTLDELIEALGHAQAARTRDIAYINGLLDQMIALGGINTPRGGA